MQTPATQPSQAPQAITTEQAAVALLHRARLGMVFRALTPQDTATDCAFDKWKSYAKGLIDLLDGAGQKLAEKDARLGGYETYGVLQAAVTRLPEGLEHLSLIEVRELLAAQHIHLSGDSITCGDVDAGEQLVHGVRATVKLDDEHAVARVDANDGAGLHGDSLVVVGADIVNEDGAA